MVEFALILPILLFLVLGMVDFGKAINYWNDTNQLAADGARFAAVNRNPAAKWATPVDFREYIRLQADTVELQEGKLADGSSSPSTQDQRLKVCIDIEDDGLGRSVGRPITVTVSTTYNLIPFLGEKTKFGSVPITGEAVMRLEQAYTGPVGCDPA